MIHHVCPTFAVVPFKFLFNENPCDLHLKTNCWRQMHFVRENNSSKGNLRYKRGTMRIQTSNSYVSFSIGDHAVGAGRRGIKPRQCWHGNGTSLSFKDIDPRYWGDHRHVCVAPTNHDIESISASCASILCQTHMCIKRGDVNLWVWYFSEEILPSLCVLLLNSVWVTNFA